jgi:hypothetical protein
MVKLEKAFLIAFLIFSIVFTISGFFSRGWPVFLGLTLITSTVVAMIGRWNHAPESHSASAESSSQGNKVA